LSLADGGTPADGGCPEGSGAAPVPEGGQAKVRILLIEDNPGDADLLAELLGRSDGVTFDLVWVERLEPALGRLRHEQFDVVLLDLGLPDSDGLDTFTRAHVEEPGIPILVLTGRNDQELSTQAVRRGAQDYLVKGQVTADGLARAIRYAIERHRLLAEINAASLTDELTGLYNRRGLLMAAGPLFKTVARLRKGMTLLFIDLDGMKAINDTLGHQAGDQALIELAEVLRETFRVSDLTARLGGDEFAVLAVGTSPDSGPMLEARLRERVRARNAAASRPFALSLSVGLVHCDPERPLSVEQMLKIADARMYEQKKGKRVAPDDQG
jgi:diguanylate cyclase (GGDEF)-like protein